MKSMTGYGASEGRVGKGIVFAEVKSVNSRFLDINCKLQTRMFALEPMIKKSLQNKLIRGKVDVFLKERAEVAEVVEFNVNTDLVKQYRKCLNQITSMLGVKTSSHLLEVVDLKDLLIAQEKKVDIGRFWRQIEKILLCAAGKLDSMRRKEGQAIKRDQLMRLKKLEGLVRRIEARAVKWLKEYRAKIERRMEANGRMDTDIALLSDKADVTEEITRLKSHIAQYRALVAKDASIGRQLDFLLQEMHREINTLGSKALDSAISGFVVETKSELEKLREQVQNIE